MKTLTTFATTTTTIKTTIKTTRRNEKRGSALVPKAASMKIFKGGKKEIMLGARENLLHMIETSDESGIESAVEELRNLYDGEAEQPAKSRLLEGKWKLLWSKQTSENVNPFQKLLAGLAKDTNFQIVEENGTRVVNDVEVAKFLRVQAMARSSVASDVRTNVTIDTVDITLFGKKVKTITLEPSPGKGQGYVEQLYLDDKVRVSVGNKGSVFVHERVGTYTNDDDEDNDSSENATKKEERSLALV